MVKEISIESYLEKAQKVPLVDVRSPKEYNHAHIPGAVNIPLFTDEERAIVGTTYKKDGRQAAIMKGLEIVGPKMGEFLEGAAQALTESEGLITLHCWRGGMRSKSMATLFDFAGIKTEVIKGGYKNYRREAKKLFKEKWNITILGGRTGSAKTKILQELKNCGEQIVDLEKLANHKGSAFGDLGEEAQPSTEMFENLLFEELRQLNPEKRIWLEDESNLIGTVFIPDAIWKQMRDASVVFCDFPVDERISYLVNTYGDFEKEGIINAVNKITRKLGGQHAKAAIEAFENGNLEVATRIVLVYYDKAYAHGLSLRNQDNVFNIKMDRINPGENAVHILNELRKFKINHREHRENSHGEHKVNFL